MIAARNRSVSGTLIAARDLAGIILCRAIFGEGAAVDAGAGRKAITVKPTFCCVDAGFSLFRQTVRENDSLTVASAMLMR